MSVQQNVAQQVAPRLARIERMAAWFASGADGDPWLPALLEARGFDIAQGILADLSHWPCGRYATGLWLAAGGRFHRLEVEIPPDGEPVVLLEFEDVTASIDIDGHRRGIGATFGFLAMEVLRRRLGPSAPDPCADR